MAWYDSVVALVEPVDLVGIISKHENPNEMSNYSAMRRVLLKEKSTLQDKTKSAVKGRETHALKAFRSHWLHFKSTLQSCMNVALRARQNVNEHRFTLSPSNMIVCSQRM